MLTTSRWTRSFLGVWAAGLLLGGCGGQPQTSTIEPAGPAAPAVVQPDKGDLLGCPYPSGDVWQTNIQNAPLAKNSAAEIQATVDAGGGGAFRAAAPVTNERINAATNSTPLVKVRPKEHHIPYSPWPWQSGFYIEQAHDAHAMVLQSNDCEFYEGYLVSYGGGALAMDNGIMLNLNQPFKRPETGGGSEESGIQLGLVAVRPEELTAGVIQHALGWDTVSHSLSQTACVSPAGVTDCTGDLPYRGPDAEAKNAMPFGAHIRLQASFDDSGFPREAKIVAEALKNYGAYAFTAGCCNTIPFANDANGAPTWTSADQRAIQSIKLSNFDVVQAP